MKRWITLWACSVLPIAAMAADNNPQALIEKIEAMQKQLAAQQAAIEALKEELTAQQAKVDEVIETTALAQEATGSDISLGKGVDGLKLKGDLRLRYERRADEDASVDDRIRTRFRLGMLWRNDAENWEVGAGLATGGDDPTSTNDTWSDDRPFETDNINLDYAYSQHTLGCVTLTLGQQKNPLVGSGMLIDSDVRPAGATVQYRDMGIFATGGLYDVFDNGDDMGALYAGQIGYTAEQEDGIDYTVALAYLDYTNKAEVVVGAPVDPDYDFEILDLYASVGIPVGDASVSLYVDYFTNLGADGAAGQLAGVDPDDEDTGFVIGIGAKVGAFSASYAYGEIEADSCPEHLKDGDFGGTAGLDDTDVRGHKFGVGYKISKNCSLKGTAFFLEQMEANDDEADLYQIDVSYKF